MSVDLTGIKNEIQSILTTANDAGATYDLSAGMTKRVKSVLTVNPGKIPIQASFFPYVTVYIERKDIDLETITVNQIAGKRSAVIEFNIVGGLWYTRITDPRKDEADNEIEHLMENIEQVLRANHTLNNKVLWTKPVNTEYHTVPYGEETILRVGLCNFTAKVFY